METALLLDGSVPSDHPSGRPPALKPKHIGVLRDIVTVRAQVSLQEISDELHERCSIRARATVPRALRAQGIVRLKPVNRRHTSAEGKAGQRYGYTAAHRREDVPQYCTNLTA